MMNNYRVHEVAKDFKLNSKDIAEIMTKYSQTGSWPLFSTI